MTDTPDFLKNTNTVFYYKSSDHKYNYWSNSSGDNVVEDKYTGLCKVTIFTKKGPPIIIGVKHFDNALDVVNKFKFKMKDKDDG